MVIQRDIMLAITHTASYEMVRYALVTRMANFLCTLFTVFWCCFSFNIYAQTGAPYLYTEMAQLA